MMPIPKNCTPNYWLSCISLKENTTITPLQIMEHLEKHNIETRPIWKPMSLQPYYTPYDIVTTSSTPASHNIYNQGLCLPSDVKMTKEEQSKVCNLILNMFCDV